MAITINSTTPSDESQQWVSVQVEADGDKCNFNHTAPAELEGDDLQAYVDGREGFYKREVLRNMYPTADCYNADLETFEKWIADGRVNPEITETIVTPAVAAKDAVMGERQVVVDSEVEEEVSKTEVVLKDGKYVQQTTTETVTNTINEPQFTEQQLYNEDGTPMTQVVTPAVEAVAAVEGVEAVEAVEAAEAVKGERQKYDEKEVSEEVTNVSFEEGEDGNYVRTETTKTETRTERTPLYTDHPVVNPDGTPCLRVVTPAKEAVVDEDGNEIEPAVAEVTEQITHKCAVMEEYVVSEAVEAVEGVEGVEAVEAVEAVAEVTEPVMHKVPVMEEYEVSPAVEAVEETSETVVVRAETVVEKVAWKDTAE